MLVRPSYVYWVAYLLIGLLIFCAVCAVYVIVFEALSNWLFGKPLMVSGGNDLGPWSEAFLLLWPVWVALVGVAVVLLVASVVPDSSQADSTAQSASNDGSAPAAGLRNGVRTRMPRDADDFETVSAEWVNRCGVTAKRTAKGPDGGLDLLGPNFAGQCKFHSASKVGAPDVQRLAGAAQQAGRQNKAFFHYGPGYTESAIQAAQKLGVELWMIDADQMTFRRVK